jgi:uncharacterized membrane protein YeaQ/YmgE (transglycosylase-associated protein family)
LSRRLAIFAFWLLGFGIGFLGYLSLPSFAGWFALVIPNFNHINQAVIGALIAGVIGSAVSTFSVVTWANRGATV